MLAFGRRYGLVGRNGALRASWEGGCVHCNLPSGEHCYDAQQSSGCGMCLCECEDDPICSQIMLSARWQFTGGLPSACWPCAGTGKTTLLRALAAHQIKGIPDNCQILHVEQEVHALVLRGLKQHVSYVAQARFFVRTMSCRGTVQQLACPADRIIDTSSRPEDNLHDAHQRMKVLPVSA